MSADPTAELLGSLPPAAAAVRRAAFTRLGAGTAADVAVLAADTGLSAPTTRDALAALVAAGTATVDRAGAVVAVGGLSVVPAGHQLVLDGRPFWTWCAFDGVGIPAALGADALARTRCGHCGSPLEVRIVAGHPPAGGPVVGWLPGRACGNVQADFCPQANLFCTAEHLDQWRAGAGDPPGRAATLTELAALGTDVWADLRPPAWP